MGNSKHRKNHKQKVLSFKVKRVENINKTKKLQKKFLDEYMDQKELARKESIIETIYKNRPEFVVEKDNALFLNKDAVETLNGILVWKKDQNPVLAGLEPLENYPLYTEEIVNDVLSTMIQKAQLRLLAQQQNIKENLSDVVNVGGYSEPELMLVEDPSFSTDSNTIEGATSIPIEEVKNEENKA